MRFLFCFAAGSFSALAMAPWGAFPALIAGLSILYVFVLQSPRPLVSFLLGWAFGFGYFVFGLSWVGNALLVDGNPYRWAWPLAVCGLPFILSFFPAFACLLTKRFSNLDKVSGFLAFCALMAFFEWGRGHMFTGFPWNLYGHSWVNVLPILQVLSLLDVYWLTGLTVLWFTAPGFIYASNAERKNKKILALLLAASFVGCFSFGYMRLQQPAPADVESAQVHLVQANIPQSEKWKRDQMWSQFMRQIAMSAPDGPSHGKATYVIWPETALNQWILDDPEAMMQIKAMLALYDAPAYLLTGALRRAPESGHFYNSLVMIGKDGAISNIYDKSHLVPFGEYIPFQKWIPLEPVARFRGFAGGEGPRNFLTPEGLKYSPVICYEIIFSGKVAKQTDRPDFIFNVTNDSWYGKSAGPWQHLAQAVFRAIEEGIPVVRVADTGSSAVISPYGHIIEKTGLFAQYEKTLALPGRIMVSKLNRTVNTGLFLGCVLILVWLGYLKKQ